jgi:hypothetical protein
MADEQATNEQTNPGFDWDFFLAHAGADLEVAKKLQDALQPPARVFLDDSDIDLGENWDAKLAEALRSSLIHVILISPNTETAYYECEEIAVAVQMAREDPHTRRVVPVYLNTKGVPSVVPYGLKIKHGLSVPDSKDLTTAKERLLRTWKELVRYEAKKEREVEKKQEAVRNITSGNNTALLGGLVEITKVFHPLLKALFFLLGLVIVLVVVCFIFAPPDVRGLAVIVLGVFGAALLAAVLIIVKVSLGYAQRIAQGQINGG